MEHDSSELRLDAPTVLLIADGERFADALSSYLRKHDTHVETATAQTAAGAAFVSAPDLIVLAGDAAIDHGADVLAALAGNSMTATLPVAIIADGEAPRALGDLRHGIVAVVQRSASADEMARRIAEIAAEVPDRSGQTRGALGVENLDELIELLAESLRSGVLTLQHEGGEEAQILLRADRPVDEMVAELVQRLRPMSEQPGELRYEFQEAVPSRLSAIDEGDEATGLLESLHGRRLLVIEHDPARSDLLAQDLRRTGATVVVIGGEGQSLELARELQPEVVIVDGAGVEGWAVGALRGVRHDPWMRWASVLLVDTNRLWRDPRRPDLGLLAHSITGLLEPDRQLAERAAKHEVVETRLETVGPIRLLRALAETGLGLRLRVRHPRVALEIDLADGLVVGARASTKGPRGEESEGPAALATLLGLGGGRVSVKRVNAPRSTNVMAPIDAATRAAAAESPLVAPSIPPPSMPPSLRPDVTVPPIPSGSGPGIDALVGQLEGILSQLKTGQLSMPPGATAASPSAAPSAADLPAVTEDDGEGSATNVLDQAPLRRLRKRMQSQPKLAIPKPGASMQPKPIPPPAPGLLGKPGGFPGGQLPGKRKRRNPTLLMGSGERELPLDETAEVAAPPAAVSEQTQPSIPAPPMFLAAQAEPSAEAEPDILDELEDLEGRAQPAEARFARPDPLDETLPADAPVEPLADALDPPDRTAQLSPPDSVAPEPVIAEPVIAEPMVAEPAREPVVSTPHAQPVAPEADVFDVAMGVSPEASAPPEPARRSRLPMILGAVATLAVLGAGGAAAFWWLTDSTDVGPPDPTPDVSPVDVEPQDVGPEDVEPEDVEPSDDPPDDVETPADLAAGNDAGAGPLDASTNTEVVADASTDGGAEQLVADAPPADGLSPEDPLEGAEGDLDLESLGVVTIERPITPRRRRRLLLRLIQQGNQARRRDQLERAERRYLRALGLDADNARATAGLTRVYLARDAHEPARLLAQRLCRLRPTIYSNYVLLGDVLLAAGDNTSARRAFEHATQLSPGASAPHQRLEELDEAL